MQADWRTPVAWAVAWLGIGAMAGLLAAVLAVVVVLAWPASIVILGALAFAAAFAWALGHLISGGHLR